MAVAVERAPVQWSSGASAEPYAAAYWRDRAGDGHVAVNGRVVTQAWHSAYVGRWADWCEAGADLVALLDGDLLA